jgi:peptidyl-tRNA hydrolase, PTH1 family
MAEERWLIVGLGNPGRSYAGNRHNAGFLVADLLAARAGVRFRRDRSRAEVATGQIAAVPVILAKPKTFMNLSGGPVASLCGYYRIPPDRIVALHDELDLPFGTIRLKLGGGDNGHNGLRSVTAVIGRNYHRVRLGIGRPSGPMDPADYVLHDFSAAERAQLPEVLGRAADATTTLLTSGLTAAQNEFHSVGPPA